MLGRACYNAGGKSEDGQATVETAVAVFLILVFLIGALEFSLASVARFSAALATFAGTRAAALQPERALDNARMALGRVAGLAIDPALLLGTVQEKVFPIDVKRDGKHVEASAVYYRPESFLRSIWSGFAFYRVTHRFRLPVENEKMYSTEGQEPWSVALR